MIALENNLLFDLACNEYKLSHKYSLHGIFHWKSVYKNSLEISKGLNLELSLEEIRFFQLFAITHDVGRINEMRDKNHNVRSCNFIKEHSTQIKEQIGDLYDTLLNAVYNHNNGKYTTQVLHEKICLDADRLDLVRLDIKPKAIYLHTSYAKEKAKYLNDKYS